MAFDFLQGRRVLDLSQFLPGPYAAQLLGDMGADVVKVEPPAGDPLRALNPITGELTGTGTSPFYRAVNGGKRVVFLNLKDDGDRDRFAALVGAADALVESYRPGVLDRLGFGPERLRGINPGLVHCALSGYGQTGPHRLRAGHDVNYLAMTGALAATGPASAPAVPWPPVADHASALFAAFAVASALAGRAATGKGAYIDTSLADSGLAWQSWGLTQGAERGAAFLNGGAACYNLYETKDGGFISLGAVEPKFWATFCDAVGHPEWTARQTDAMPQTDLIAAVAAVVAARTRDEWDALLGDKDVCYHPVLDYGEVAAHEQVAARGLVRDRGTHTEVAFPAWVDGAPPQGRPAVDDVAVDAVLEGWASAGE